MECAELLSHACLVQRCHALQYQYSAGTGTRVSWVGTLIADVAELVVEPMDQGRRFLFPRRHSSSSRRVRIDRDVQSHGVPPRGASWLEDLRRLKATGLTNLYWPQQIFIRQALDSAEKGRWFHSNSGELHRGAPIRSLCLWGPSDPGPVRRWVRADLWQVREVRLRCTQGCGGGPLLAGVTLGVSLFPHGPRQGLAPPHPAGRGRTGSGGEGAWHAGPVIQHCFSVAFVPSGPRCCFSRFRAEKKRARDGGVWTLERMTSQAGPVPLASWLGLEFGCCRVPCILLFAGWTVHRFFFFFLPCIKRQISDEFIALVHGAYACKDCRCRLADGGLCWNGSS